MFVIINSTPTRINKSHLVDLYEKVSWAAPDKKFAAQVVEHAVRRGGQPAALPINRLGGRSKQEKWILQAELFNEIHRWVIGRLEEAAEAGDRPRRWSSASTRWCATSSRPPRRCGARRGATPNYMVTRPVTLKAMLRVCADLAHVDAEPVDGRVRSAGSAARAVDRRDRDVPQRRLLRALPGQGPGRARRPHPPRARPPRRHRTRRPQEARTGRRGIATRSAALDPRVGRGSCRGPRRGHGWGTMPGDANRARPRVLWALWVMVFVAVGGAGCSSKGGSGIGGSIPCDGPRDCASGKVCAGGTCADPGNGRPGHAVFGDARLRRGKLLRRPHRRLHDGRRPRHRRRVHVRSAVQPAAALRDDRVLRNVRRRAATTDLGGACHATADCLSGLYCGAGAQCAPLKTAFPPFAGATCTDEGAFRGYFEVPRPGKPPADFFRLPFPNDVARHRRERSTSPTSPSRDRRRWASTSCSSTSTPGRPTSTASRPRPASRSASPTTSTTRPRPATSCS